ncbi:xylose isomerase domain protein TIM barrel [Arthrobacter sp. Hiyo8]|nr:xylose isomerase domain protein TIM barrel [Arthrobacter sp. Hiyo8]
MTDLWVACANYQRGMPGYYVFDRFRTDAPWADQLVAIEKFLRLLAPVARDHGVHMNIETHEEITSYEIVRLVEAVGRMSSGSPSTPPTWWCEGKTLWLLRVALHRTPGPRTCGILSSVNRTASLAGSSRRSARARSIGTRCSASCTPRTGPAALDRERRSHPAFADRPRRS